MGNFLKSCCPPSAYAITRYQAVAVRPREGSEGEALQLEIRTQQSGWQTARSSSDDEPLCIGSESEDEFVIFKLDEEEPARKGSSKQGESLENPSTVVPTHIREKIDDGFRGANIKSRTQTAGPQRVTAFERLCFDINQSSESVNNTTVSISPKRKHENNSYESSTDQNQVNVITSQCDQREGSIILGSDRPLHQINSKRTPLMKPSSGVAIGVQRAPAAVRPHVETLKVEMQASNYQLSQSIGVAHPHSSHEYHFANLLVNPIADADPAVSMYGGSVRERVSLPPDVLTAESPPTASLELEWEKEPSMSHYKQEKPLPSASNTVDSSLGGMSSSRLRSLCSTPASLEWDFKESTTSLQEVPLGEEEEEAWGASDTEELLQEIELLAARALYDDADDANSQPPVHDR